MNKVIPILTLTILFAGCLFGCAGNSSNHAPAGREELNVQVGGEVDIDALMFTGTWVNESGVILLDLKSDRTGYYYDNADQDPTPITWEADASMLVIHPENSDEIIATFEQNKGEGTYTHIETGEVCTNTRNSD